MYNIEIHKHAVVRIELTRPIYIWLTNIINLLVKFR